MHLNLYLLVLASTFSLNLIPSTVLASNTSREISPNSQDHPGVLSLLEFTRYVDKFHKNYNAGEAIRRAKIFVVRTMEIFKHNVLFMFRKSNFLEQNQFTDLTAEEAKTKFTIDLGLNPVAEETRRYKRQISDFMFMDDFVNPFDTMSGLRDDKSINDWTIGDLVGSVKKIYDMVRAGNELEIEKDSPTLAKRSSPLKDMARKTSRSIDVKYSIDWRKSGCINRPKFQENCNSCYAHAMLDILEFHHCRQTNKLTQFSSQYVIDCGYKTGLMGCKGGKLGDLARFIRLYGMEPEESYRYTDRQGNCPYNRDQDEQKISGPIRALEINLYEIKQMEKWDEWLRRAPLIVGINMPSDFLSYGGGVHDGSNCLSDMVHAMVLVGSGTEDGKPFWLLRNTFSDNWGEDGYMRLAKNAPRNCFYVGAYVRAKF